MQNENELLSEDGKPPPLFVLMRLAEFLPGKEETLFRAGWLENQCRLVELYSRPSLAFQSDQNYEWLVSASDRLPEARLSLIREAIDALGTLILQSGSEHSSKTFERYLTKVSGDYLTVRFDSDDVLHPSFVERAKYAYDIEKDVYSFKSGIVYDLDQQIAGFWPHASNTFLFHRGAAGSNVYNLGVHTRVEADYSTRLHIISTANPMWMKLTHRNNGWGDRITNADKPLFGSFVQRTFPSGSFPTRFKLRRDVARLFGYYRFWLRAAILKGRRFTQSRTKN